MTVAVSDSTRSSESNLRPMQIIGSGRSHDVLREVLGQLPSGRVLDIPCGTGVLSKWLLEQGWDVHCADIDRENFQLADDIGFTQIDLNRQLPFEDASFEYVVCANGLHRVFFARGAVAEFARVLRPGGHLVLNLNNYASLINRIRVLLCGSVSHMFDQEFFEQTLDVPESMVRIAYPFSQIANYMYLAGFEIRSLHAANRLRRHRIASRLGWPFRMMSILACRRCRHPEVVRWNAHPAVFSGGAYLVAIAQKPQ